MTDKPPFPTAKVVDSTIHKTGLYRRYETHIVIDEPFSIFMEDRIALDFGDGNPFPLKFSMATQKEIDGKLYTVLVRESYVLEEENEIE